MEPVLKRALWEFRRLGTLIGLAGALGCALLVANGVVWFAAYLPMREALVRQRLDNAAGTQDLAARRAVSSTLRSPDAQLRRFYGFLPHARDLPASIANIRKAAARHGVTIDQGEFRLVTEADGRLSTYQMLFPVKAGYRNTRGFVSDVMRELPSASLEEITFRREEVGSRDLESRLRFVLFLSEAP